MLNRFQNCNCIHTISLAFTTQKHITEPVSIPSLKLFKVTESVVNIIILDNDQSMTPNNIDRSKVFLSKINKVQVKNIHQ